MLRRARFVVPFGLFGLLLACSSSTTSSPSPSPSPDGGATNDASTSDAGGSGGSTCEITRAFVLRCAGEGELNCGVDKYDAWCAANDTKINSEAFRRAEAKCLPGVACEAKDRNDCEYASLAADTPTAAQKALVQAYCSTCEPDDSAGCATRVTAYSGNPDDVGDVFIAAWELADPIVDQIREKCTGAALPAGADPCAKRFGTCAGDQYLGAVPDCP